MGIFFSIMDSDHSREKSHVERVESHVQNIKARRLSMMRFMVGRC